jgi:uncharacterized membrane protein YbhN (UPF0104 family)
VAGSIGPGTKFPSLGQVRYAELRDQFQIQAAGLLAGGAAALAVYVALRRRGRFERFAAAIRPVARASRIFARPEGILLLALSGLIWVLEGTTFMAITRAADLEVALLPALAIVVLASLAAAIPAAPGYAGTFDAALLVGLHGAGIGGGDAVTLLILTRFLLFVPVTLVGLAVLIVGYGGLPRSTRASRAPGEHQELLAEDAPGERRREVSPGHPGARG